MTFMKPLWMTVKLIATIAAVSSAPLLAQTTALAQAADGMMLGS